MLTLLPLLLLSCRGDADSESAPALQLDDRPTNVLVISIDTLRPDMLGLYAGTDDTPVLDALLSGGVVLSDHQSCANWTFAAMICAQAGLRPEDQGFVPLRDDEDFEPLPDSIPLVSELLSDEGFRTALVTTNSNFSPDTAMVRGFDDVRYGPGLGASWVTEEALLAAEALDTDDPWYLHTHFLDPHTPYNPPAEFIGELEGEIRYDLSTREGYEDMSAQWEALEEDEQALVMSHLLGRYRAELRFMDKQIGDLIDGLDARGMMDDTLIVLFSDHGEQFYEQGHFGHGHSLYTQEIAALAAFNAPGLTPGVWDAPTRIEDVWPTALEALSIERPSIMTGEVAGLRSASDVRANIRIRTDSVAQSAESKGLKLMVWWNGNWELYQLTSDPNEKKPLQDLTAQGVQPLWDTLQDDALMLDLMLPNQSPMFDPALEEVMLR